MVGETISYVRLWGFILWTTGKALEAVQQGDAILSTGWRTDLWEVILLSRRTGRRP